MRSIRGKLFLSMGMLIILLFVLNYFLPKFFIFRDSNDTSKVLLAKFEDMEARYHKLIAIWISHYFIHNANQLETFAKITKNALPKSVNKESLLTMGAQLITYNPSLAYVELQGASGESVALAPEDATLYTPLWAPLEEGKVALYFPNHRPSYYVAIPLLKEEDDSSFFQYYGLEEAEVKLPSASFKKLDDLALPGNFARSAEGFYKFLNTQEDLLLIKADLIRKLVGVGEGKKALFVMDQQKNQGYALFAGEVFWDPTLIKREESPTKWSGLSLLIRHKEAPKLDLVMPFEVDGIKLSIALSFSMMAREISETLGKPIVLSDGNVLTLLYQSGKKPIVLSPDDGFSSQEPFSWEGVEYNPYLIQLKNLNVSVLTPSAEFNQIPLLMKKLGEKLEKKISINLLVSGFIGLMIALIILSRLSKRITQPIAQLAHAAEEIGQGKYEGVVFPDIKGRKDEVAIFSDSFKKMVAALADREKIHGVLNKVVSTEIAAEILQGSVELGGEERVVTLLFSDIRNFTHLSNTLHPKEVIEMLNDYMTTMCQEIDKTQGVVDKFVGDEIIALYGAPLMVKDHADQAVKAAIAMIYSLKEWNKKRLQTGKAVLEIGIGLHTGVVCSGNMGAANRLNYTVIGANVNLASRLCGAALPMQIVLSKETKAALVEGRDYGIRSIPPLALKGFDQPIEVFEIRPLSKVKE